MSYRPRPAVRPGSRPIYHGRRRSPHWRRIAVVIGVPFLLIVLLVYSCRGGGGASADRIDAVKFMDTVRPFVQRSNDIGKAFRQIPESIGSFTRASLASALDKQKADAELVLGDFLIGVPAPPRWALPAFAYLVTTLRSRVAGLDSIKKPLLDANLASEAGIALTAVRAGLSGLSLSDETYRYFSDEIRSKLAVARQRSEVPASSYLKDSAFGTPGGQEDLVAELRTAAGLRPATDVGYEEVLTNPASDSATGEVFSLPLAERLGVVVKVRNFGTTEARNIAVKARIESSRNPAGQEDSTVIESITPGESSTVELVKFNPDKDVETKLTVTVAYADDQNPINNEKVIRFNMRSA